MKQALLIVLTLIVMLAPGCTRQPAAVTTSAPDNITMTFDIQIDVNQNMVVNESCSDCTTFIPTLKCPGTLKWKVGITNASSATVEASIGNFQEVVIKSSGGMGYSSPPAGLFTGASTPPFKFSTSGEVSSNPQIKGTYKYAVIVTLTESGKTKQLTLDPRVVFDY